MENTIVNEMTGILKQLSPENQMYFMNMVRVAKASEGSTDFMKVCCLYKKPEHKDT